MCLSDAALDCMKQGEEKLAVIAEAKLNAKNFQFSSFLCMLALSSVLQLPIESYIPIAAESGTSSLSCMFNCTILPRQIRKWFLEKLHIFRCASIPFDYLQKPIIPSKKNHYVALCKSHAQSSDQGYFKPILVNTARLYLAYSQPENIQRALQGSTDATFVSSTVEGTSGNICN